MNPRALACLLVAGLFSHFANASDFTRAGSDYDPFMGVVKSVLSQLDGREKASLEQVRKLMQEGRSFRYAYTSSFYAAAPSETANRRAGDCKDKALWLASKLNDPSVRFVVGKFRRGQSLNHAWLYWKDSANRGWILDCTYHQEPIPADSVPDGRYVPLCSWSGSDEEIIRASRS